MDRTHVVVRCPSCEFETEYSSLGSARNAVFEHQETTGHSPEWEIERLSPGVERAGNDAGVCGQTGCENPDSPLLVGNHTEPIGERQSAEDAASETDGNQSDGNQSDGNQSDENRSDDEPVA